MSPKSMPRHEAVERHIRSRIASLQPGDPIESDAELVDLFQVSRMTVRQAMHRLVAEGAIYRVSGVGTFVGHPEVHRQMGKLRSFTEEMALRGHRASSRLVSAGIRRGAKNELAALQLPPRSNVVEVRRLRLADDEPMAIEAVVLPPSLAWVLDRGLENASLHALLKNQRVIPTRAVGTQIAGLANEEDAKLLGLDEGAPIFIEQRLITDEGGSPIESTETRYAGSRFVFHIELMT